MRLALLLVCLLASNAHALRPRQLACLGDSNTAAGWPTADVERWCEYAGSVCPAATFGRRHARPVEWFNFGIGGAAVLEPWIGYMLDEARDVGADYVVLAFGTNDHALETPAEYAGNVWRACRRARRRCYVLSMPPHPGIDVDAYNAAVAAVVPAARIIDRTSDMMFIDDAVHLDDASQQLLGARVAVALGCIE